jgi:septal ring factor EnvC (AmiA/AmiB activator)
MNWSTVASWIPAIVSVSGIASLLLVPAWKRKIRGDGHVSEADAASRLSDAALKLLEPARQEIDRLNRRLAEAHREINKLEAEVHSARDQVGTITKELQASREEIIRLGGGISWP